MAIINCDKSYHHYFSRYNSKMKIIIKIKIIIWKKYSLEKLIIWSIYISNFQLLSLQFYYFRYKLEEIQQQIYTWSNDTDVLFVADFPGMHLDNYITKNFTNVTLTVLEGEVTYSDERREHDIMVAKGSSIPIETGQFHKVKTVSAYPACYMYTCTNRNKQQSGINGYFTIL